MSTVQVSNITDGTNSVETVYVARGSAKAWVNFNGTGTIAARDSLNLSSLTDNGTGDYTPNFTNNFANANYSVSTASNAGGTFVNRHIGPTSYAVGSVRINVNAFDGTSFDNEFVNVAIHGDLA